MSDWFLYIVATSGKKPKLYTGVTTDPDRRVAEHNAGTGAKALRGQRPVTLLHYWCIGSDPLRESANSRALRAEAWVKSLTRQEKLLLLHKTELLPHRFGQIFGVTAAPDLVRSLVAEKSLPRSPSGVA